MKAADTESTRGVLQVIEAIGLPAVLEQGAEELAELTQASLSKWPESSGVKTPRP